MTKKQTPTPKLPVGARMMTVYGTTRTGQPTFKLIPIHKDCPYMEATFNPSSNSLELVHELTFNRVTFLPEVDERGQIVWPKKEDGTVDNTMTPRQERRTDLPAFYDYELLTEPDIVNFIIHFTGQSWDWVHSMLDKFWTKPAEPTKKTPAEPTPDAPLSIVSEDNEKK